MGKWLLSVLALVLGVALVAADVEAKRLGGARSSGVQRNTTTPPAATPAKPAQQQAAPQGAQQAAPAAAPGAAGAAAAAKPASGLAKWFPMLGGLALGGMLGWLFATNGGSFLLLALLAIAAVVVFSLLARRKQAEHTVQYAGGAQERVSLPEATAASAPMASRAAMNGIALPAGFDAAGFLRGAKMNFVRLQLANDHGSMDEIREFTTPEMYDVLARDIRARAGESQHTDVSGLDAELIELTTEGGQHWASVRFSGTERENGHAEQFAEVWNLAKPVDGSTGWLLAGIQQMH